MAAPVEIEEIAAPAKTEASEGIVARGKFRSLLTAMRKAQPRTRLRLPNPEAEGAAGRVVANRKAAVYNGIIIKVPGNRQVVLTLKSYPHCQKHCSDIGARSSLNGVKNHRCRLFCLPNQRY
jgi:hypothetical protein